MSREKHFFEVYSPEYNILKTPGSPAKHCFAEDLGENILKLQ